MIISVAITADNLDVLNPDSRGGYEVYQGSYGVKQAEIRIDNRNVEN